MPNPNDLRAKTLRQISDQRRRKTSKRIYMFNAAPLRDTIIKCIDRRYTSEFMQSLSCVCVSVCVAHKANVKCQ